MPNTSWIADEVIFGKEYRKVSIFLKNTNVSGLWPFFSERKNRCTVLRNTVDIKMIAARSPVIARARWFNVRIQIKLKLIFSLLGLMVLSWKINRISRFFRWMLVPLHNATACTWTSEVNLAMSLLVSLVFLTCFFISCCCYFWHGWHNVSNSFYENCTRMMCQ